MLKISGFVFFCGHSVYIIRKKRFKCHKQFLYVWLWLSPNIAQLVLLKISTVAYSLGSLWQLQDIDTNM